MNTITSYRDDAVTYWHLIKDLSDEAKLRLITLLSQSISSKLEQSQKKKNSTITSEFISEFYGAWSGDTPAEEIIKTIEESRSDKDPIAFE